MEIEYDNDVEDDSEAPLPYLVLATNNLAALLQDELGAVCVFCFERPQITLDTTVTDVSTAICSFL